MKGPLGLLQLLCIIFLSRFDITEGRFLDIRTNRNIRSVTVAGRYSYKLYMDYKRWHEARDRCISDGGDLATVDTLEKRNRIRHELRGVNEWFHVGLYRNTENWISVDKGLPVTSSLPWFRYKGPSKYNCAIMSSDSGNLRNGRCTSMNKSLCKIPITLPEGYSIYPGDNVAYKVYQDKKTWYESRAQCISDGGDLAAVDTLEKRHHIQETLPEEWGFTFVGLYKPAGAQNWISVDNGLPVETSSLPWYAQFNDSVYNCIQMYHDDGNLWNQLCTDTEKSLCEIRIGNNMTVDETELQMTYPETTEEVTTEATTKVAPVVNLPPGYLAYPCFKAAYKFYTDKKTWAEARDRCVSDGGHLVIADTREKLDHIRIMILNKAQWVFVGIHKPAGAQEWIRVDDGLPVQNIIWADAVYEENDILNCSIVPYFESGLMNWNCAFRENSICEIQIGENKIVD